MTVVERNGVIGNIFSGALNSVQSVIWLSIITRILGIEDAGIFTIAYASASLFLTIGTYGMRNFQISDVKNEYCWKEYYLSRFITIGVMLLAAAVYCGYMSVSGLYTLRKAGIVFGTTLLKSVDAYEDIYHGQYQKEGRLDIAGFSMSIRLAVQIIIFAVFIIMSRDLMMSLYITVICSFIILLFLIKQGNKYIFFSSGSFRMACLKKLLYTCLPICLSLFIAFYLNNLSKYVIDFLLEETDQAYYGFLSMPVFVIYLFANYVYMPMVNKMSYMWSQHDLSGFVRSLIKIFFLITGIAIIVLSAGWLLGVDVLGIIYGVDLDEYKKVLMVLLCGSVLYAYFSFFSVAITIMRLQRFLLIINCIVAILSQFFTYRMVMQSHLNGAALSYLYTMGIIAVFYFFVIFVGLKKLSREEK